MHSGSQSRAAGGRDLRIDWLRGLAMTCVIVNHSKMSSLLSWFSYERFWVVTAAEVFVLLSGIVLGMVYGTKFIRDGWRVVIRGLGQRALTLYVAFVAVTVSMLVLSLAGVDVGSLTSWDNGSAAWFLDPRTMTPSAWRDVALMRYGPWAFEIVGLYVWLVAAAVPCLFVLRFVGWRPLLALSWTLYFWYRIAPHPVTSAEFEDDVPILAWQLLFVHGLTIGYHRERLSGFVSRFPKVVPMVTACVASAFMVLALCNPWVDGPSWLHLGVVSPERFTYLYEHFFGLTDLGIGRLLNLAVGLSVGYAILTSGWSVARRLGIVFVTLGQRSLGAFVLHVYGILLLANLPHEDRFWVDTLLQLTLIVAIVALLHGVHLLRLSRRGAPATLFWRALARSSHHDRLDSASLSPGCSSSSGGVRSSRSRRAWLAIADGEQSHGKHVFQRLRIAPDRHDTWPNQRPRARLHDARLRTGEGGAGRRRQTCDPATQRATFLSVYDDNAELTEN